MVIENTKFSIFSNHLPKILEIVGFLLLSLAIKSSGVGNLDHKEPVSCQIEACAPRYLEPHLRPVDKFTVLLQDVISGKVEYMLFIIGLKLPSIKCLILLISSLNFVVKILLISVFTSLSKEVTAAGIPVFALSNFKNALSILLLRSETVF